MKSYGLPKKMMPIKCYLLKTHKRIRVLYGLITCLVQVNYGFSKTFFLKKHGFGKKPMVFGNFGEKTRFREKIYKKIGFRFARYEVELI